MKKKEVEKIRQEEAAVVIKTGQNETIKIKAQKMTFGIRQSIMNGTSGLITQHGRKRIRNVWCVPTPVSDWKWYLTPIKELTVI